MKKAIDKQIRGVLQTKLGLPETVAGRMVDPAASIWRACCTMDTRSLRIAGSISLADLASAFAEARGPGTQCEFYVDDSGQITTKKPGNGQTIR